MGRWVINGLTIELCHLFRLGFFRNENNNIPCICSFHFVFIVAECGTGQSIINVILLTSAGVLCLSIIWKESKIGLFQSFFFQEAKCLSLNHSILPPSLHPVPSVHKHHKYFLFQDYLGLKTTKNDRVKGLFQDKLFSFPSMQKTRARLFKAGLRWPRVSAKS